MTKKNVREALELKTDAALARYLNVSRAAVAQWPEDEPIPEARQNWLRLHRPDKFPLPPPPEGDERGGVAHAA